MGANLVNGGESDNVINRNLIGEVANKMLELGQDDPGYGGDFPLVTKDSLDIAVKRRRDVASSPDSLGHSTNTRK